ncbi:hypothetical protein V3C99_007587 [Haemonchus contortus]|uniref:Transposase n=1 Tax=Haemonchus contortus TaxID=6289 RepID=A0A7I4YP39_HAECO
MSQSATDQTTAARYPTRRRKPIQPTPVILTAPTLDDDARGLLNQINEILVAKAPEAIPLLQQFLRPVDGYASFHSRYQRAKHLKTSREL